MSTKTMKAQKPISQKQYESAIARYAENAAASKKIIAKSEEKIKEEMKKREAALGDMPAQLEEDAAIIQRYCEDNYETLFSEGKSIQANGLTLAFRTGSPSLAFDDDAEEKDLLVELKKRSMTTYINVKESLDKKKIIADRELKDVQRVLDKVGASVEQYETFKITP